MTGTPRPWWASDEAASGLDGLDPVEAFRAVRRPVGTRGDRDEPADPGPADPGRVGSRSDGGSGDAPHRPELCGVCPLCTLARSLEETRPELMEHLTEAARHLSAAVRALLEPPGPGPASSAPRDRLQHIDVERAGEEPPATDPGAGL